jgi:HEAT repeat protein
MSLLSRKEESLKKYLTDLKDPEAEVRRRAAYELSNLRNKEAIPHLMGSLSDEDKKVRWRVAYALADFGESGSDLAFESLVSHLKNEQNWNVRRIIVMSLRHWDQRGIPYLIEALSDESKYVRRYAAMTLGFKKSKEAVDALEKLALEDDSAIVKDYARWALKKI